MKRKFYLIFLILFSFIVVSTTVTENKIDDVTAKNFTFSGNENKTFDISINRNANVTSAKMNMSGFLGNKAFTFFCLQETANKSELNDGDCGQNYTKGIITTSTFGTVGTIVNINYSKPDGAVGSLWEIFAGGIPRTNYTLPNACFNAFDNSVSVRLGSQRVNGGVTESFGECFNGSGWTEIFSVSESATGIGSPTTLSKIFDTSWEDVGTQFTCSTGFNEWNLGSPFCALVEEAMNWDIRNQSFPTNSSLEIGTIDGLHEWNFTGELNTSNSRNQTNDFSTALNTALNSGQCDCDGCVNDTDNCIIPAQLHSDSAGILQINAISMKSLIPPKLTQSGLTNFTQTVQANQNLTFNLLISHDFTPDTNFTATYNITFSNNNSNTTLGSQFTRIIVTNDSTNTTEISINISSIASLINYSFNVTVTEENEDTRTQFPVFLTIVNKTAIISFTDTSNWVVSGNNDANFTNELTISNTGNLNATSCTFRMTDDLNAFLSQNESDFTIEDGTNKTILVTIENPSIAIYDEFLILDCDSNGNTISTSPNINAIFIITAPAVGVSTGGGGSPTEIVCDQDEVKWSLKTTSGTSAFSLLLPTESSRPRSRDLVLNNFGTEEVTIELTIINSTISEFIELESDSITLTPNELIDVNVPFFVTPPTDAKNGDLFTFSILATDNVACHGIVGIEARVSLFGNLFKWSTIPFSKLSPDLEDVDYPVILPAIIFSIITFILSLIFLSKLRLTSIFVGIGSTIIVFVLTFIIL